MVLYNRYGLIHAQDGPGSLLILADAYPVRERWRPSRAVLCVNSTYPGFMAPVHPCFWAEWMGAF